MSEAVEFGGLPTANEYRDEHEEWICPVDDDRRQKTVHFVSDAPDWLLDQARAEAAEGQAEREAGPGQVPLTDAEKDRIDFSEGRANVPWARSIKGLAEHYNVSDWTAYLDETLTVDEHRDVMERAGQEGGGARDDGDQRNADRAQQAAARVQGEGCNHAEDHCKHGDADACEYLQTACGLSEEEVQTILGEFGEDDAETVTIGGEEFEEMEVTPEVAGAMQRSWSGYQGAVNGLDELLDQLVSDWYHAQEAARAINAVREANGLDEIHFHELEAVQAELSDLTARMAEDCHECHADHSDHDHDGLDVEDLEQMGFDAKAASGSEAGDSGQAEETMEERAQKLRDRHREREIEARQALRQVPDPEEYDPEPDREEAGVAPKRQLDDAVGASVGSIRNVDRDRPEQIEQFREMMAKGASNVDAGPLEVQDDPQASLDVGTDVRQDQGRDTRHEAERNPGGLEADRRDDADRGAENSQPETEQRKFADPEQSSLSDL